MNDNLIEREHGAIFQTYKRLPITIEKALGCEIWDGEGKRYLDFLGGIAVNALGHSHPKIIDAVCEQAKKYMHVSNYFYQEPQIALAEKIKEVGGFDRVFFSNSGTEAMEGAMKLARRWGHDKGKSDFVAFSGGFHGRTYGALSIMDKPQYKENMGPFLEGTKIAKYNDIEDLRAKVDEKTCAVVLEFFQGEGGISSPTDEFAKEIMNLKDKFGFLLIADEIQAGAGRTGKFYGFEHFAVKPDIATMAKGIGGGLPLGAIVAKEALASVWDKGNHGTTYGGNAVACAAGLAVVNELTEGGVMENARIQGEFLKGELSQLQVKYPALITELRGTGLMLGVVLSFPAAELVDSMLELGVIANAASGTVLRLVPPLVIKREECIEFIDKLDNCLAIR